MLSLAGSSGHSVWYQLKAALVPPPRAARSASRVRSDAPTYHASMNAGDLGALTVDRAFERFFNAHEREITGYLWRMTGDEQTASDLSQETFLRAWQRFDRIREYERPGGWLFRVATNLALQHLRRNQAPIAAAGPLDDTWMPGASDPGRRFVERDLVRETLLELTPKARALLVLREVYGLSAEEVGDALKMSREAVKVGLWRARAQFRDLYTRKEVR